MQYPENRKFAFTILDDTDDSTLENVKPVYDRLLEYGLLTTKTAWPLDCPEGSPAYHAADTLNRPEYLDFVKMLVSRGVELALHGATMESSDRARTLRGLAFLEREFGHCPRLYANHGQNAENLYWGAARFHTAPIRALLRLLERVRGNGSSGEIEGSPFFWGDLARERIRFVRNFTFRDLNLLKSNPEMPYCNARTPYVHYWFSTLDAPEVRAFRRRITPDAIDRLEEEGGVCIVSTHLGKGFARDGRLDPDFDRTLRHIAEKPGWFVPVSTILEHLLEHGARAGRELGALELLRLELRYLVDRSVEVATARMKDSS